MRKLLVIIVVYLTLILSTVPVRAKCDGGETIQGVANHHSYCKSTTGMTWWAAFAWCKYQGRELATMLEAFPNTYGAIGNGACPNLMVDKNEVI